MNWRKEAQERLKNYDRLRHAYHNIPLEIRRLEVEAQDPKRASLGGVCGKGNGRCEDKLLSNIVQRQELQWAWDHTKLWLEVTNGALEYLEPEEKLILQRLYIYQEKDGLERLCQELGVEQSSIYRRRDRALEKFTLALYGAENSVPQIIS